MANKIQLRVVTPSRLVLEEQVDEVTLPGYLGALGILPEHTPLLARLGIGPCSYKMGREDTFLAVAGGFAEVGPDHVTVLADDAWLKDEIDLEAARLEAREAETAFNRAAMEEQDEARARLESAQARIRVAENR